MTDQKTPRSLPLSEAITIAAQAISEVMSGRSLTEVLDQLEAHERPIVQSLSFDALRKWVRSQELIKQFIPKTPPPEVDHLLSVAIDTGYYDQSHFIKHFKAFSTQTPSQFFENNSSEKVSDFYNL